MEEITITKIITWVISTISGVFVLYRAINADYREGIFTRRRNSIKFIRYVSERKESNSQSVESIREQELVFKHFFGKSVNANYMDYYIKFYNKMGVDFTCYSMKCIFSFLKFNYELKEFQIMYSEKKYKLASKFYWFGFILYTISIFSTYIYVFLLSDDLRTNVLNTLGIDIVTFILVVVAFFSFGTGLLFANDNIRKAAYFKRQFEELNR